MVKDSVVETTKIFRFRVWKDKVTKAYATDDDVYVNDVPVDFLEMFDRSQKSPVFSIFADNGAIKEAEGSILLLLSEDREAISNYVSGFLFGLKIDKVFDQETR